MVSRHGQPRPDGAVAMTWAEQKAYDVDRVLFNTAEEAETCEYQGNASDPPDPVSVRALWGVIEVADYGQGFVGDAVTVQVPSADLLHHALVAFEPGRGRTLYRDPAGDREAWEVLAWRKLDGDVFEADLLRANSLRPTP